MKNLRNDTVQFKFVPREFHISLFFPLHNSSTIIEIILIIDILNY